MYYGIHRGHKIGVFDNWDEVEQYVKGYRNALYKKFKLYEDALDYANNGILTITFGQKRKHSNVDLVKSEDNWLVNKNQISPIKSILPFNKTEKKSIDIFTDGSCTNNGKKNAYGGIGIFFGDNDERNVSEKYINDPTSQRCELYAIIKALEIIKDDNDLKYVFIYTDSQYCLKSATVWIAKWSCNGWQTSKGNDVKNKELMEQLWELLNHYKNNNKEIMFRKVESHQSKPKEFDINNKKTHEYNIWYGNDQADILAKNGAESL